jgi:hypothetical protein
VSYQRECLVVGCENVPRSGSATCEAHNGPWKAAPPAEPPYPFATINYEPPPPPAAAGFASAAAGLAKTLEEKNRAYGNSWAKAGSMLTLLWPNGVQPKDYLAAAVFVRMFDKMSRVAEGDPASEEDAMKDLAGYALLLWANRTD